MALFHHQDDILAELEQLEQEALDEQLMDVAGPEIDHLPAVPNVEPAAAEQPTRGRQQLLINFKTGNYASIKQKLRCRCLYKLILQWNMTAYKMLSLNMK